MNILIVNRITVDPHLGGTENVSFNLAERFNLLGHKTSFLSLQQFEYQEKIVKKSNSQFYLPISENCDCEENIEYIITLLRTLQVDIIIDQMPIVLDLSLLLIKLKKEFINQNVKLVVALHNFPICFTRDIEDFILYKEQKGLLFMKEKMSYNPIKWASALILMLLYNLYRLNRVKDNEIKKLHLMYNNSDAFVLLSKKFEKPFSSLIKEKLLIKLHSINNPVHKQSNNIKICDKEKIILYVGRLERVQKRVDRLLMIWKKLYIGFQDWRLVIVGDGNHRIDLEEMVKRHKLERVEFVGRVEPTEYYRRSSILTLTSTYEGFGLVLMEAQQAGCIPVAFNSFESATDIITDGEDGFLITPFNLDAYVEKLTKLMTDEDLRITIANICLIKDYAKFDIENVVPQWIELFEKLKG